MTALTPEQRAAVVAPGNILLTACPGSGKTRVIIARLMREVEAIRGTPRAAACITYTNTAVAEIEARLRRHLPADDERHFDVATIHAFCLNAVLRPFRHLVPGLKDGCRVLTPDSDDLVRFAINAAAAHGRYNLSRTDIEEFANLQSDPDGEPIGASIVSGGVRRSEALTFWKLSRKESFVDFAGILHLSLTLLRDYSYIVDALAARYAALLIDEFQDTSAIQVDILARIAERGRSTFFLVGDPLQSIYGFTGARPDLADQFAARIGARTDLTLSGNFRSSAAIVADAERLLPRTPAMLAVGSAGRDTTPTYYRHAASAFAVLTDHFLPALEAMAIPWGNAAVLAPSWFTLFPLGRQLRRYGVAVVGPGARPYRRSHLMATLAEHLCGYLMEPKAEAIAAIERALFHTLTDATGKPPGGVLSYDGRTVVFRLIAEARRLHGMHAGVRDWLTAAAPALAAILLDARLISVEDVPLFAASVTQMLRDIQVNKVDVANLGLDDLGVFASPDAALKLSTLHNAKGREFDAVALIDLHDGRIPNFRAETVDQVEEARRLLYVGITRARRLLLLATDSSDRRNRPSRFLSASYGLGHC